MIEPSRAGVAVAGLVVLFGCGACGGSSGGTPVIGPPPPPPPPPPPVDDTTTLDLRGLATGNGFARVSGAASTGRFGVPVAGGPDCDGDGVPDYAMSNMQAAPFGRTGAGQVLLIFGDGRIDTGFDSASPRNNVLTIAGAATAEATGSEIWMADVTDDGIADLLIGRQNYREAASGRNGAGALSVVVGGPALRTLAGNGTVLDLAAPDASVNVFTVVGANALDRLGFWLRSGDVSGDGVADIIVGADQEDGPGETDRGAAYLLRGGAHLAATASVDLADFGTTALAGHLVRLLPPVGAADYHFGATVSLADLDGNGRAEVMAAASLSRVGGLLVADGAPTSSAVRNGGNLGGSLFILWDDNFGTDPTWPAGLTIAFDNAPGTTTRIDGGSVPGVYTHQRFGEDLLGGEDYDGDGSIDLYVGDIKGTARSDRPEGGVGHVFFSAAALKGLNFRMDAVPAGLTVTTLLGPEAGAITADTSAHGDFDGDGRTDLAVASPTASPQGRLEAGVIHILWGQDGPWPATIDFAAGARPDDAVFATTDLLGAQGGLSADDGGDTLMYSAAAADLDGDGRDDLIVNEMRGNGVAANANDVGNLLLIGGARIPRP